MPKTIVKDKATAEFAAQNLDKGAELPGKVDEPNTPKPKSTAEKLFPEFVADDGTVVNRPVRPYEDKAKALPVTATPAPETQSRTNPTTTPTAPVYLTIEELIGKTAKLKVDGLETDVPAESLLKNAQLERHLNAQLMNLAEERRKLELERSSLRQPAVTKEPVKEPAVKKTPELEAMEARYLEMQKQMEILQQSLVPQIQEAGKKRVAQMVKDRIGTDDFDSYFERIRDSAVAEMSRPEMASNLQARQWYDSPDYYFQKYQEMKLKEMLAKPVVPVKTNAPVLVTPDGAPVVMNNQGQVRSIPNIESSGGVPSKADANGDWAVRAQRAFDMARQTGRTEDWVSYYKLKAEAS